MYAFTILILPSRAHIYIYICECARDGITGIRKQWYNVVVCVCISADFSTCPAKRVGITANVGEHLSRERACASAGPFSALYWPNIGLGALARANELCSAGRDVW